MVTVHGYVNTLLTVRKHWYPTCACARAACELSLCCPTAVAKDIAFAGEGVNIKVCQDNVGRD